MKKPVTIKAEVLSKLNKLSRDQKAECISALCLLPEAFGNPHLHSGLGIRKLTKYAFEFRGNIQLRFLFYHRDNDFYIWFLGDHNEVKDAVKQL